MRVRVGWLSVLVVLLLAGCGPEQEAADREEGLLAPPQMVSGLSPVAVTLDLGQQNGEGSEPSTSTSAGSSGDAIGQPKVSQGPQPTASTAPELSKQLVPYKGTVEHVFFHPLIAYPELAFDDDRMAQGYNDWFTTIPEFERILKALYERDYILVHLHDVFEETVSPEGVHKLERRTLMLPEGKKPLVISIDDPNYYDYMIKNGNVFKLVVDSDGHVATYSKTPEGEERIARDNDIVPILDRFVEQFPDFSLNGAKGVLALTGYEGVLGYRTQTGSENREAEITEAKRVIQRLKETGWTFGSHTYGHIRVDKVSLEKLKADTKQWKEEVESLIGETPLFFYPYGARTDYGSSSFQFLVESGFKVISAVGPTSYTAVKNGAYTMDRRHLDGIAFIDQPHTLADLMNVEEVLDKVNRPEKYWKKK